MTGSRAMARKNEALAIGILLAASLGQLPAPANDNGKTSQLDKVPQRSRHES